MQGGSDTYKTELLNKYLVAKINGETKILEIKSIKSYLQRNLDGKNWFAASEGDSSVPIVSPTTWKNSKPRCLDALEDANSTRIFKNCRFKRSDYDLKFESITKTIICAHVTSARSVKLLCDKN